MGYKKPYRKTAKPSKTVKKYVKNALKMDKELKYHDISKTLLPVDNDTSVYIELTDINPGDDDNLRDGALVKLSHAHIRMDIERPSTGNISSYVRVQIVRWKQNSGSVAVSKTRVFTNPTNVLSTILADSKPYITILHDKLYSLSPFNINGDQKIMKLKVDLRQMKLNFNQGANSGTGHVYMIVYGDNTAASTLGSLTNYESRVFFRDA